MSENDSSNSGRPPNLALVRYAVTLGAFTTAGLFVLWTASDAIFLIFAGVLFAALLHGLVQLLGKLVAWSHGIRLAIVCFTLTLVLISGMVWGSATLVMQATELKSTLREQFSQLTEWLGQWGIELPELDGAVPGTSISAGSGYGSRGLQSLLPDLQGVFGTAWAALAVVFGALGNFVVITFLGIFFAAQPSMYRETLLLLAPPANRKRFRAVLNEIGEMLRHWLLGQSLTMGVIFLFTWSGLWLVGVGPSFALGALAGILAFIPTVGPVIAGIIIMLAGMANGLSGVIGAAAIYTGVQTLESYFLTPMIQRRAISVPPAFLFASQIVLGMLFGLYGLALATPIAALCRVLILRFYVVDRPDTGT